MTKIELQKISYKKLKVSVEFYPQIESCLQLDNYNLLQPIAVKL
jgi:hypothetical protein